MRIMESISSGQALALSAVTGGPSLIWAAATDSWGAVAVGVGVGTIGFLWTVRKAGDDQRLKSILDRLDKAEKEADDYRADGVAAKAESARLTVELASVKAQLDLTNAHNA